MNPEARIIVALILCVIGAIGGWFVIDIYPEWLIRAFLVVSIFFAGVRAFDRWVVEGYFGPWPERKERKERTRG